MKYLNAGKVLPQELLEALQDYVQGTYLYIPRREKQVQQAQRTDYRIELEKRDEHIYEKYLEGWTCRQIMPLYHLSGSSIRRIILKKKRQAEGVKYMVAEVLEKWGLKNSSIKQIYHSTWEIAGEFMLKLYQDKKALERNIQILDLLHGYGLPVAETIRTKNGEKYIYDGTYYYFLTKRLPGSNCTDIREKGMAYRMGQTTAELHLAFRKCEDRLEFWDSSLLGELKGWIKEELEQSDWELIEKSAFEETVKQLEAVYEQLPVQLIHRDVHLGNFLFDGESFSGYIDFDLSQRNIRIFDLCYFTAGLLAAADGAAIPEEEWLGILKEVFRGYESRISLTREEKLAVPYVMEGIELLFAAYFSGLEDRIRAKDAAGIFRKVRKMEVRITDTVSRGFPENGFR